MATEEAKVRMSAEDADVQAAWNRQFQNLQKAEQKLRSVGHAAEDAGKSGMSGFASMITGALGLDVVLAKVVQKIQEAHQKYVEMSKGMEGEARTLGKAERAFSLASGQAGDSKIAMEIRKAGEEVGLDDAPSLMQAEELLLKGVALADVPKVLQMQVASGRNLGDQLVKLRQLSDPKNQRGKETLKMVGLTQQQAAEMPSDELLQHVADRLNQMSKQDQQSFARGAWGKTGGGESLGAVLRIGPQQIERYKADRFTRLEVKDAALDPDKGDLRIAEIRAAGKERFGKMLGYGVLDEAYSQAAPYLVNEETATADDQGWLSWDNFSGASRKRRFEKRRAAREGRGEAAAQGSNPVTVIHEFRDPYTGDSRQTEKLPNALGRD